MEFRVLKYFLETANEGSITKAAAKLHVTQPTMSKQLKDLERELGTTLFFRTNYTIRLTESGMLLKDRAEDIIEMVEKTQQEFYSIKNTISGTVYIGSGESYAIKNVTDVMKEIQIEYSKIKFDIVSGNAQDLEEKLDKGLLDFAVLISPIDLSKYNHIALPDKDTWGLVMNKDAKLSKLKKISLSDLLEIPIICSKQITKTNIHDFNFLNWFKGNFEKLNIVATYNLVYNATLMAKSGMGYILTLDKLTDTTVNSDLIFKPLYPKLESGLNIVWKKGQIFSKPAKLFLEKLKEKFING